MPDPTSVPGRVVLTGTGQSFRELMATASGNTFVVMSGGKISAMLVELAGLDVAESLGFLVRGDQSIPIRCAVLDLQGQDGQMRVQTLVFDTSDTVVYGEGKIDLRDEQADIVVLPVPKNFSPLSLRSYIRRRGHSVTSRSFRIQSKPALIPCLRKFSMF